MMPVQGVGGGNGSFGITPQGSPAATPDPGAASEPNARSPSAKRPLDRSTIQVATSGVRTMSNEDLSSGFIQLNSGVEQDRKWLQSVADSVHWNAGLVNKLIEHVNGIEASMKLAVDKGDATDKKVDQLTSETKGMLETVQARDIEHDTKLRGELNSMSAKVEKGHTELESKLTALSEMVRNFSSSAAAAPSSPPGLDINTMNEQIAALGRMGDTMNGRIAALESITAGGRLSALEGAAAHGEKVIGANKTAVEATQAAVTKIHQEMSQTGGRVDALAAAVSATAAAPASATSAGAVFVPWYGQKLGGTTHATEHHHMGTRPQSTAGDGSEEAPLSGTGAKWRLYEEKWVLSGGASTTPASR